MRVATVAITLAAGFLSFAGCSAESEDDAVSQGSNLDGVRCTQDVWLHVRADTFFPPPNDYEGEVRPNGCWRFERPVQAGWGHCDLGKGIIKTRPEPGQDRWYYDEIWQPKHEGNDLAAIRACRGTFKVGKGDAYAVWTGIGGFGDVGCSKGICLPDGLGNRVDISPYIHRVWLETYHENSMSYFKAHRDLGRPLIDITDVEDPYAQVKKLCEDEGREGIGVYIGPAASGKFTLESFRMGRLIRAMNDCSGKGTPKNKPPPATPAPTKPEPTKPPPAEPAEPSPTPTCTPTPAGTKTTGLASGTKQICCDGKAIISGPVKDCGVGMNHSAVKLSAQCAQAGEGLGNNGSSCAEIACVIPCAQ